MYLFETKELNEYDILFLHLLSVAYAGKKLFRKKIKNPFI